MSAWDVTVCLFWLATLLQLDQVTVFTLIASLLIYVGFHPKAVMLVGCLLVTLPLVPYEVEKCALALEVGVTDVI